MAAPTHNANAVTPDTLITIKVAVDDTLKKLKLPLRDLGANVLPAKLRHLLDIKPEQTVVFERFSDSAGGFITLNPANPQVFKTLVRAAKAKLKLRLKATVTSPETQPKPEELQTLEEKITAPKTMHPVIVHSPVYEPASEDDSRTNLGCGIFEFRESRASEQTLVDTTEAPLPRPFTAVHDDSFDGRNAQAPAQLAFRTLGPNPSFAPLNSHGHPWSVYCNACDAALADVHFHCSICDGGDYDLCEECVAVGKQCPGEAHWLIKRFIKDGKVISSTTERISPHKRIAVQDLLTEETEGEKEVPGAFTDDAKTLAEESRLPTRTCNCCVIVLPETDFVTCTSCADYDLCTPCHSTNQHGHHPAHGFEPATQDTKLSLAAETMLAPGRNVRHNAICDGCDKKVYGIRHKCLVCPDWDYCNDCVKDARHTHPRHRFAAIYEPIADVQAPQVRHFGIYCDGPACSTGSEQTFITGVRYKCAVCHDTDFCANCEALPSNHHNRTHPLIKFKTPVRNVSITTENQDLRGNTRTMGDRCQVPVQGPAETKSAATETVPVQQTNAATQVQTMAEIKPSEEKKDLEAAAPTETILPSTLLNAHFVRDCIPDGMVVFPGQRLTQIWTLRNPGPNVWPSGCSVRYVGGDNMLNVDNGHPAPVSDIANATESNVVGREVLVGEEVAFIVTLKTPMREGKSISYWRLKAADGTPFGHRLWCDIEVKAFEMPKVQAPTSVPQTPPGAFASPAADAHQAHMSRMQAIHQQQVRMMMHKQMILQQNAAAQKMAADRMAATVAANRMADAASAMPAAPMQMPIHDRPEGLQSRLAWVKNEQEKHTARIASVQRQRDYAMSAHRDHFQAQGVKREDVARWPQVPNFIAEQAVAGPSKTEEDRARKDAAKQRVEHIKAKIMKTREERARRMDHVKQLATAKDKLNEYLAAEQVEKTAQDADERVKKIVEAVAKDSDREGEKAVEEEKLEGSQMVFPKLDKESPASSTYQSATSSSGKGKAAYVENEQGEVERSATPVAAVAATEPSVASPSVDEDFELLTEEIEVLNADAESEDDGFMTDEEYDILDASDHETVASK